LRNQRRGVGGRAIVIAAAVAVLALAPAAAYAVGRAARPAPVVGVPVGTIVRVNGGSVGCVARRDNGFRVFDCRRIGDLAGTYGAVIGSRTVRVVRFRDERTAAVVFTARHGSPSVHVCGGGRD
jgi:hypothetical protein